MEGVMQGLYLLWFVQERQLSPAVVATVLAAGDLALIAFEIPTGWFADRFGHRASLVVGSCVQIAGMLFCWLGHGVPALIAASLLVALGDGFRSGADQALLYRTCRALGREDSFQTIEARTCAIEQAALVLLVLIGGAVVHVWGFGAGWAGETLLCAAGLGMALLMREPPAAESDVKATPVNAPADLVSRRMLSLVLPAALLGAAAAGASFLLQTAGASGAARMSMLVAAISLAEAAGSACATRVRQSGARAQWILASAGLMLLAVGLARSSALLAMTMAVSFLAGIAHPLRATAIQRAAADEARARAASVASACDMLFSTMTLPLAGVWRARRRQ